MAQPLHLQQEIHSYSRRGLLKRTLAFIAGLGLAGKSGEIALANETDQPRSRTLLAYFSRSGENYYYGDRIDLEMGNTEVMANLIAGRADCDCYRIEAADPYSDNYDDTVERNVREQRSEARPEIANPLQSIDEYDTIVIGSPIWNVRPPRIMLTFAESHDFSGKTIIPFTTHAMSGLGRTVNEYTEACPGATFAEGLAIRGEEVGSAESEERIDAWLERIELKAS